MNLPQANIIDQIADDRDELRDENVRLKDRIKQLEEAGDALANNHNPFTFIDWYKAKESKP
jgi:cell division septum initiation protein DivIVA